MEEGGGSAWIGTRWGRTLKLAFRLFPWHVGALNACGAFNFAAAPWKFARKLAARPTGSARHGWKIGVFRPCCFLDSGGLGLRTNAIAHFSALAPLRFVGTTHPHAHLRPTSKATAGSARTRQGTLGSLDPPFAAAPSDEPTFHLETQAQAATTAAQRRLPELRPHQKRTPAVKRRPPARRPRRPNAAAVACRFSLPAGSARTRQGTLGSLDPPSAAAPSDEPTFHLETQAQAATTAAQRRQFELRPHQKRTPAVKRRPPARRPRRPNAAATGCRLSLPQPAVRTGRTRWR